MLRSGSLIVALSASAPDHFFAQEKDLRIASQSYGDILEIQFEETAPLLLAACASNTTVCKDGIPNSEQLRADRTTINLRKRNHRLPQRRRWNAST